MFLQYGKLSLITAEIGWRPELGAAYSKFQRVSRFGFVTALTSLIGGQLNIVRCLVVSWAGTLYILFRGLLPPNGILPGAVGVSQILRR